MKWLVMEDEKIIIMMIVLFPHQQLYKKRDMSKKKMIKWLVMEDEEIKGAEVNNRESGRWIK